MQLYKSGGHKRRDQVVKTVVVLFAFTQAMAKIDINQFRFLRCAFSLSDFYQSQAYDFVYVLLRCTHFMSRFIVYLHDCFMRFVLRLNR